MSGFSEFTAQTIELADRRFTIRRALEADLSRLVALLRDDALGATREGSGHGEDMDDYHRAFDLVDADPNQLLLAIEETAYEEAAPKESVDAADSTTPSSPVIVGTLQLSLIPSLSRQGSTRLQIEAVRIGQAAQGLGLGTAVFEWAHDCGRRFGASLVQLTTDKSRADAQRFYARLGYEASHEGLKLNLG